MRRHRESGNTLAMIAVVTIVLLAVVLFMLFYISMLRSGTEHRTAIESAAIAAAKDISRIVINTPEFGYVGLTTEAPAGRGTVAGDNYFQEVRSINELMATARLDLIIADQLGDNFAKRLAVVDYNNVKKVKDDLITALTSAVTPTGSGRDSAGNTIRPYQSAERVYLRNQGRGSTYVPNSMSLTLGGIEGGMETSTPAPVPLSKGACTGKESNGRYLSETSIPFQGTDFVFASVGRRVSLCERSKFRTTVPGLPFQMPAVVNVSATQRFQDQGKTWTVNYGACACAGSNEPPRPAPGALTLSFPDGPIPEMVDVGDVITLVGGATMNLYESAGGDFIKDKALGAGLAPFLGTIPFSSSPPSAVEVAELAFYDWVRCGGSRVNIDSILALQTMSLHPPSTTTTMWRAPHPLNPNNIVNLGPIPTGVMHIYTFRPDGTINYVWRDIKPYPYTTLSENQLYAEFTEREEYTSDVDDWDINNVPYIDRNGQLKMGEIKGTKKYDMFVRDLARVPGTINGGKHGGERMDGNPLISRGSIQWDKRELLMACADLPPTGPAATPDQFFGEGGGSRGSTTSTSSASASGPVSGTSSSGSAGKGEPPMISRQDDFASSAVPQAPFVNFTQGPGGGAARPTWTRNGLACDIRFRRQLKVGDLAFQIGGFEIGYVGEMR